MSDGDRLLSWIEGQGMTLRQYAASVGQSYHYVYTQAVRREPSKDYLLWFIRYYGWELASSIFQVSLSPLGAQDGN
jgi:hypothetical protein